MWYIGWGTVSDVWQTRYKAIMQRLLVLGTTFPTWITRHKQLKSRRKKKESYPHSPSTERKQDRKKKSVIQRTSEIASSGIPFKDRGKLGHYVSCFREDDGTLNYLPGQLWHKGGGVFPCKQSEITSRSLLTTVATWHSFTCTRTTLLTRRSRGCRDN